MSAPKSLTYGDLSTRAEEYEAMQPVRSAIEDFYVGGYRLAQNVGKYIPRLSGENPKRYAERIKSGSYFNYFAQITDYHASALFTQELAIREASDHDDPATPGETAPDDVYETFSKNADGNGRNLNEVCQGLIVTALKQGNAWLRIEMPEALPVRTRAEEEELGLGMPYLFEVPHEQVIDWDRDDDGELTYAVIHAVKKLRGSPGARRKSIVESFEVWRVEDDSPELNNEGAVTWARYEIEYPESKKPKETDDCRLVDEGSTSFPRIPLLSMQVPDGLWLGNKLGPMAREHYARRTTLNSAEDRSLVAIPVMKRGPEVPAPSEAISEVQTNDKRGEDPVAAFRAAGYTVIGSGDAIEFVEPKGSAYEHVAKRIDDLKSEMFRISHQLAASASMSAGSVRRSGQSKQEDRAAEALVLGALGRVVRDFGVRIFDTISQARGDDVVWVAHGLDTYEHEEREQTLEESIQIQAVSIPSATFRKEHCKRVYRKLVVNLPPQTTSAIDAEIEAGVDAEQKQRDAEAKAALEAVKNPPKPDVEPAADKSLNGDRDPDDE